MAVPNARHGNSYLFGTIERTMKVAAICRCQLAVGAAAVLLMLANSHRVSAIETTYGEDRIPNAQCRPGSIQLGYGVDPIPDLSLKQRWHNRQNAKEAWRYAPTARPVGTGPAAPASSVRASRAGSKPRIHSLAR